MGGFFTPKAKAAPSFMPQDRQDVINPLIDEIGFLGKRFNPKELMNAFQTPMAGTDLEGQAASALMGFNPESYFQGSQGMLGQAGGLFSNAAGLVGSDPLGAKAQFSEFLSPGFADVQNNPQVQGVLSALQNQGQQTFNIGADKIAQSAAQAAGGLGQGTAATNQLSRLQQNVNQDLSNQAANIMLGEQGRRQGYQLAAAQQGLGQDIREANALGLLGSQMGNLGLGQAGMGLQGVSGLADLGGRFMGRELAGQMLPLDLQFQLGNLLKTGAVTSPSPFATLTGAAGQAGAFMGGMGQLKGAKK